jgi:hypothetical protein
VVLKSVLLDLITQGIQKVVVRVVVRTEELVGLLHQRAVRLQLFGFHREQLRTVRE